MREMKNSGVEWIGEVPENWTLMTIGSLFHVRNEKVSDTEFAPLSVSRGGVVPQMENVAKTDANDNRKLVMKNDFAINSRSDRKQSCGVSPLDGSVSLINTVLYAAPTAPMVTEYPNILMKNYGFAEEFYRWGHGIVADLWTTRWQEMKSILLPVPPVDEQQRILVQVVAEAQRIADLIANQEAQIEKLKVYKQSLITEVVTKGLDVSVDLKDSYCHWLGKVPHDWYVLPLKYICDMQAGKNLISEQISEKGEYPVYGGNGLRGYYSDFNYDGDFLLVGRQGALCGNVHRVENRFWATEHAVVTMPKDNVEIDFLYYLLVGMNLNQFVSPTAAQPGLAVNTMQNIKTCIPERSTQDLITAYLNERCRNIDRLIAIKQAKIEKLSEYKKSLIYEYVTGKKEVIAANV